jgi:hypothetical protein
MLGVTAAGLGMYCLYLQWRVNLLNEAGMFTAALLVKTIQHYTSMDEEDAKKEAHRLLQERAAPNNH